MGTHNDSNNFSPLRRMFINQLDSYSGGSKSNTPFIWPGITRHRRYPFLGELFRLMPRLKERDNNPNDQILDTWTASDIAHLTSLNEHQKMALGLLQDDYLQRFGNV